MVFNMNKAKLLLETLLNKRSGFLEWVEVYLRCAGLRPTRHPLDSVRILYNITVMSVCGVSGWAMFYLKYDDLSINTDVLIHAVCTCHTLYIYIMLLFHQKKLYNLYNMMHTRFKTVSFQKLKSEGYQYIWDEADRLSMNLIRFGIYWGVAVFSMYVYNSGLFSSDRILVYPLWVPYTLQSNFNYYITVFIQLSMFALYIYINVSSHVFGIGGAHFIGASYDVLGNLFIDICNDQKQGFDTLGQNFNSDISQRLEIMKLKIFVEAHDSVLCLLKDYKSVYDVIYIEVILVCEMVICFCGFQLVMATEVQNMKRMVMLFGWAILMSFHLFLYCYQGQHIYNKSEKFQTSLYLSHWEDQHLIFKKSLSFMLRNTMIPVSISFKGVVKASMHSYLNAMKTAFSYVNILLILREIN